MSSCQISLENELTVKNLNAAFACELNAHAKCLAFAVRAESERRFEAARLFRAVGRSEKIRVDNHARVIRQLGGEPESRVDSAEVKSTEENLALLLEEETRKIDSMYPRFIQENRSTNNSAARSFTWALEAGKGNTHLLTEMIEQMRNDEANESTEAQLELYIRPVCGYVSRSREQERCWNCAHFCKTFEVIE